MHLLTEWKVYLKSLTKDDSSRPRIIAIILFVQDRICDFKGYYWSVMIQKYKQVREEKKLSELYSLTLGLLGFKHATYKLDEKLLTRLVLLNNWYPDSRRDSRID